MFRRTEILETINFRAETHLKLHGRKGQKIGRENTSQPIQTHQTSSTEDKNIPKKTYLRKSPNSEPAN